jgi:hypothetical protein
MTLINRKPLSPFTSPRRGEVGAIGRARARRIATGEGAATQDEMSFPLTRPAASLLATLSPAERG